MKGRYADLDDLLAGEPPPVVVFAGSEEFLRREGTSRLLERIHGGAPREEETLHHRGGKLTADELPKLFDDLKTPSLFGGTRSVVVNEAERALAIDPDAWVTAIGEGWSGVTLVLLMDAIDARTKVAKAINKAGWVIKVEKPFHRPPPWKPDAPPWEHDLNRWIISRARREGLRLDPPTAHLLQVRIGTALGDLAGAIERLATVYSGQGKITREEIERHTPDGEESSIFELVDAFFLGVRARTAELGNELLHRGSVDGRGQRTTDPAGLLLQFIGAALRRLRQLREIHRITAAGGGEPEILREAGIARPFLPRLLRQANQTPPEALERIVLQLRRADRDLKTGKVSRPAELLARMIHEPRREKRQEIRPT